MSDAIRFLGVVNSAQLYSISTGVEVGDVCYADDVQKTFIYTETGWAQLGVAPPQAENISVSPLRLAATDDAETPKCDCDSHYLKLNTKQVSRMVAENLKVFIRELTKEIENGTLVFNEKEMEDRIEKLFCDQM